VGEELDSPRLTQTQNRRDSRMNRTPEHPDRLSLSRLLLLASLITRPFQTVSESTSHHISRTLFSLVVATFACNKELLSLYHWEGRGTLPHEFDNISSSSHCQRDGKATSPTLSGQFHIYQSDLIYHLITSGAQTILYVTVPRGASGHLVLHPSIAACAPTPTQGRLLTST
jgi:hypothetical protein